MSQPERQERITETLALLGRLTPAALPVDRDELFFRAGEASARGELAPSSFSRRFAWPAIAATLALVVVGLGYSMANREPEIQIVYVKSRVGSARQSTADRTVGSAHHPLANPTIVDDVNSASDNGDPPATPQFMQARYPHGFGTRSDIIHPHDWAALSDAFAQQLRLHQERSEAVASIAGSQDNDNARINQPRDGPRTYLELRDSMRAM